jgi:GH15 family glucan-1,4-alpha-glucosidase
LYAYGLIGNCQASALIGQKGSLDWLCLPRPDSPPVFGRLLDPDGGHFSIELVDCAESSQHYLPNTNVLVTLLRASDGSAIEITDFCPRFLQHGRAYRPTALFRRIELKGGNPRIRVQCRPVDGWDKNAVRAVRGNSHLRWEMPGAELRLLTNMPLTFLCEETEFSLTEPVYFGLTWGVGVEDDLLKVTNDFLERTIDYWRTWVKHCSIPTLYQKETIRSALALKLHCYEDTGAILAALTTSLPEEVGGGRNWDYRFCWLRDAYFVLSAFRNLGHFEEMEGFIKFLLGVAHHHEHSRDRLGPVYALDHLLPLPETEHPAWAGYQASGPVRSKNQAAEHVQNDVYGEMVLTLAPIFLDERFRHLRTPAHEELISHLAGLCAKTISIPDAGLWELRNGWQEHSFSNLMCWAGLDRAHKIRQAGYLKGLDFDLPSSRARAEQAIEAAVVQGSLRNGPKDPSFDAALLQLSTLRFPDRELCKGTVMSIADELGQGTGPGVPGFLYRYKRKDDFGAPQSAFVICSFWLAQAYAAVGEPGKAAEVMDQVLGSSNGVGLLAEHFQPAFGLQSGNFPQAYSHVGLINAAFAISPPWEQVL